MHFLEGNRNKEYLWTFLCSSLPYLPIVHTETEAWKYFLVPCRGWVSRKLISSCALQLIQITSSQSSIQASNRFPYNSHWQESSLWPQYLSKPWDLCLHLLVLCTSLCIGHQTRRDTSGLGFNWTLLWISWWLPGNQLTFHSLWWRATGVST